MPPRGPYPKGLAKREEILGVALQVFAQHGYDKTSVREVARATGLSQAGLLHHFSSKEQLFVEVLRRRDARDQRRFDADQDHSLTAEGLFAAVGHNAEEPGLVRLYVAMAAENFEEGSAAREFFEHRYRSIIAGISGDIRRRQATGEVSGTLDADATAEILVAAADGLQIQWLLDPDGVDMGERLAGLWKALLQVP